MSTSLPHFVTPRFERRRLDVGDARIHFQVGGEGEPLILIHGLSGSGRWWRRNMAGLARRFRLLIVDLIGFGRSRGAFVLAEAAGVVAEWMGHLGLTRAHVVGHSMGGFIAAELAADVPERVDRLVLVDAAAFPVGWSPFRNAVSLARAALYMHPTFFPVLVADALRAGPLTLLRAAREVAVTDLGTRCEEVRAPTLVVWGEHDRVIPLEVGERLATCLPDGELAIVEGAGHNPMWDRPAAFNRVVLDFLTAHRSDKGRRSEVL